MFSGIIEELGTVISLDQPKAISRLQASAPRIAAGVQLGESICVNGVCLTVVNKEKAVLTFEIMQETLRCSQLGLLQPKDKVNLERALRFDGRIDGHFVTGHVDGTGTVSRIEKKAAETVITVKAQQPILCYIVLKGALALEGVSLSVSAQEADTFSVNLIPYTLEHTTLGLRRPGDIVNIEADILAKYLERLAAKKGPASSNITSSFLQEHGFI